MPDIPTRAADNFVIAVERVTRGLAAWVADNAPDLSPNDLVIWIRQLPMESLITDTLGFSGDIAALEAAQLQMLQNFEQVAPITPAVVQSLIDVNQATFMQYVTTMSGVIRQEMVKAVLAGVPKNQFVNRIADLAGQTLSRGQVKTIVDTALKTFTRQVNAAMALEMPADTKYIYVGITDEKTRDVCLAMITAGALTKEEIIQKFPGSWVDGGGFNCRHRWAPQTEFSQKFQDPVTANQFIAFKQQQGTYNPQTLQEQAGG